MNGLGNRRSWAIRAIITGVTAAYLVGPLPVNAATASRHCPLITADPNAAAPEATDALRITSADIVATQSGVTVAIRVRNLRGSDLASTSGDAYSFVFSARTGSYHLDAQSSPLGPSFQAGAWQYDGGSGGGGYSLSGTPVKGKFDMAHNTIYISAPLSSLIGPLGSPGPPPITTGARYFHFTIDSGRNVGYTPATSVTAGVDHVESSSIFRVGMRCIQSYPVS